MIEKNLELEILVEPILEHIVPILRDALSTCSERHLSAVDKGADNYTYGTDAWEIPNNQIKEKILDDKIPFAKAPGHGFGFCFDNFTIRPYRVGNSVHDNIWRCFPNSSKMISGESALQLWLFDEDPDVQEPENVVLAFMANPYQGLCAVYLTRVARIEKERIVEWSEAVEVWKREDVLPIEKASIETPPTEAPRVPIIRRVAKRKESRSGNEAAEG